MLTGSQIRRKFLDYFIRKGHKEVHSSSLVPANDPTLLFTNAGMNQFKDVFLGLEKRDYNKATTSQKCVRAGGKHNDLENVGFTNRHHTFFEMLGNFSFGDYFKKDAIAYAWELITSPEWFGIDKSKLYVTVFKGENSVPRDAEAYDLWAAQGVAKDRIFEFGAKDNFWQMGDTGPCGPCSEIHYDMGPAASDQGHTDCKFGCDCGRYVEIWNLVFMQFDRDASGKLTPLPKPSIDTGMGLERVASVLQGVISNYETDLFTPLIDKAAELIAGKKVLPFPDTISITTPKLGLKQLDYHNPFLRVIADHSRASTFLISDGVLPGNNRRESVLRRILRRGIYHGRMLGLEKPFMYEMADAVVEQMKGPYPELTENADHIRKVILDEEKRFARTLHEGLPKLEQEFVSKEILENLVEVIDKHSDALAKRRESELELLNQANDFELMKAELQVGGSEIPVMYFSSLIKETLPRTDWAKFPGRTAFYLYETYGLPRDFIEDVALSKFFVLDVVGFEEARSEEKARARASWKGASKSTAPQVYQQIAGGLFSYPLPGGGVQIPAVIRTEFEGYARTRSTNCTVEAIVKDARAVYELKPGEEGEIILDHTPFYSESGGQVGDRGWLYSDDHNTVVADVKGCYYPVQGVRAHQVNAKQAIRVGDKVDAVVDTSIREATMRNHTATHLLHAGLREVLGKHVKQAGSLVAPNHLRFDFSHFTAVEDEELQDIEDIINKEVLRNQKVETIADVPIDVAVNEYHAMALFGEKYGDKVRVVRIGDFSTELCGGTHTLATGEIGLIKILKEGSVSSGVRRVEAVTGEGSLAHFRKDHALENVVASIATHTEGTSPADALKAELERKDAEIKRLARELDQARMKSASSTVASVSDKIKDVRGVKVLAHRVDNLERSQMRTLVDQLRDKLGSGVVVLGSATNGNVSLIATVTKDLTSRVQAGKVIGPVAQKVGGKGGGRPDMAEAGGKDPAALDAALAEVYKVVETLLG
jgi:alanyl-tRNA synthetase